MSTVRSLVNRAHRYLKTYGSGETPTDDDADVGLDDLKAMLRTAISDGLFGPLTEVYTADDYEAGENERITLSGTPTITYPTTVVDAVTGETRAPEDRAVVVVTPNIYKFYDADQGVWVSIEDLTLNSAEPLYAFNLGWLLAEHMAESFGVEMGAFALGRAIRSRAALRIKKPIRVTVPLPLTRLHANRR